MKRLRVLALMHEQLVPPESIKGMTPQEINPWRMEYEVRGALRELGHEVHVLGVGDELAPIRRAIDAHQPQVCFNLLTHFLDLGAYHAHVVSYLELLKACYTGCNPRGLLLAGDKALSKKILAYHRIRVPRFWVFRLGNSAPAAARLPYPLIVKSIAEQASIGIAQASVVHDADALRARVEFVHRTVGTDAIAEQYVEGRELTIGVIGNERIEALPVRETTFASLPDGAEPILTAKSKWDLRYQKKIGLRSGPADLPPARVLEIARLARRTFRALGLSGYARLDLRLAADGTVFAIDANPNPDLCRDEDFAAAAAQVGVGYGDLIQRILNLALRYRPAWKGG